MNTHTEFSEDANKENVIQPKKKWKNTAYICHSCGNYLDSGGSYLFRTGRRV